MLDTRPEYFPFTAPTSNLRRSTSVLVGEDIIPRSFAGGENNSPDWL